MLPSVFNYYAIINCCIYLIVKGNSNIVILKSFSTYSFNRWKRNILREIKISFTVSGGIELPETSLNDPLPCLRHQFASTRRGGAAVDKPDNSRWYKELISNVPVRT